MTCTKLTKADVAGLMSNPVAKVTVATAGFNEHPGQQCTFSDADGEQGVEVLVFAADDPNLGYEAGKKQAGDTVAVAGVGDKAYRARDDYSPTAVHSGVSCWVGISNETQLPGFATTGGASPTYTDTQNDTLAQALGTVCNRLFGAGNTTPTFGGVWDETTPSST